MFLLSASNHHSISVSSCLIICFYWLQSLTNALALAAAPSPSRFCVVGVGVLGSSLCQQILREFEDESVTGVTKTSNRHSIIREKVMEGSSTSPDDRLELVTMDDLLSGLGETRHFQNVVFCAPPSGFEDYPAAVKKAAEELWQGPQGGGSFVFTSSGAVYGPEDVTTVTESSPMVDVKSNPRSARLLLAEQACLEAGGCCLRLAGLYNLDRGAHNFWITKGRVSGSPDGIINLLHYDDAASACLAALKRQWQDPTAAASNADQRIFLLSDGHPMTRREICQSALQARIYKECHMPEFVEAPADGPPGGATSLGKIYDGSWSNKVLHWTQKY